MAQYGMVIMDNLMKNQLIQIEKIATQYINMDKDTKVKSIQKWIKIEPGYLNVVFFEKKDDNYTSYFKYPNTFDETPLILNEFSGFFMINNNLYQGCLKKQNQCAILISFAVTQKFLDEFATISDFRMKFQSPNINKTKEVLKIATDPELINDEVLFPFPWMYKYKFLDFNTLKDLKPMEKFSHFWFFLDLQKIYTKITDMKSGTVQTDLKKAIYILIFFFGTFIIISFIIGFRSVRVITRSINLITKGTQRIRNGDFYFRIKTKSGDQLQYLAESFNEMAAGIDRLLIEEKEKQRLEEELRIARSIQLKLLPPDSYSTDEFEIAAINIPATEIAGDYFDYFHKKDEYLSILVADVSGKGTSAAFYMAELKGVINHLQMKDISPATLISECHDSLNSSFDRVTFITISIAKFIIPKKKFLFTRAGHTQAIFYNSKKKDCIELYPEGMAIGLLNFSREKIKEIQISYTSGDILFLFSDGLSEIMNDEDQMLGVKNLKKIIKDNHHLSADNIKQKILDFAISFSDIEIKRDDLTFIILKVK